MSFCFQQSAVCSGRRTASRDEMSDDDEQPFELEAETPATAAAPSDFLLIFNTFDKEIEGELLERAWRSYDSTPQQILLEGNKEAWMVCAFYTAVLQATPAHEEPVYQFSLLGLLKQCNLSVLEFFDKLNKWVEMVGGTRRVQDHVSRIQATLAVSTVIYKKYLPIFRSMFCQHTSTDKKKMSTAKLFEFIWVTFLSLKKRLPNGLEDLLNSYHVLLCVIDLIAEELQQEQSPLLNPEFVHLMETSGSKSTLDFLCHQFDGVELDAKHMLLHWVIPKLESMQVNQQLMPKDPNNPHEVGLIPHWSINLSEMNHTYEKLTIRRLEVDERMFIAHLQQDVSTVFNQQFDDAAITILKRGNLESSWAIDADLLLRVSTQRCLEKVQLTVKPLNTPLTARSYVISSEQFCPATPISAAAQRTQKLHDLFINDYAQSESEFDVLISQCRDNPRLFIDTQLRTLEQMIHHRVEDERQVRGADFDAGFGCQLEQRLNNVAMVFWRLLQKTIMTDRQRNPRAEPSDLSAILHKADFITGLYLCALEIVLMTYNSEREFPWSVDTVGMPPINFYTVIEIVVRAEPELSREMVKHLNHCEERVLEELAWAVDSPLWAALARRPDGVPPCAAVTYAEMGGVISGPLRTGPMPSTISVRYPPSPMKPLDRMSAKRRMEFGDEEVPHKKVTDAVYTMPSGTTLFFRKVYYLAAVRLNDLCDRLRMEEAARNRVWTLFEHVLRAETALMHGRHIDQNLMCCVYITAKISNMDLSFHRIMQHYRHQPQSSSRIYRQVLAERPAGGAAGNALNSDDTASRDSVGSFGGQSGEKLRSGSAVPQAARTSAPQTPEPQTDFIDLIKYYNRVFVPRVEDFVKKLHPTNGDSKENITSIISMPKIPCTTLSPRRMVNEQLSIVPMSSVTHVPRRAGGPPNVAVKQEPHAANVGSATVIRRFHPLASQRSARVKMPQRLTYRRRHPYNTKSNKTKVSKTPGGRNVVLYRKKQGSIPVCGDTGVKLQGIKAARPRQLKQRTRRTKTVSRTYGGVLSAGAVRQRIIRAFLSMEQKIASKILKQVDTKK
ncbi:hypothetical protein M3Y99_00385500 [Aphelenchoides fujianensis]|nr:hypothetical protein M3Y99_00385500 [Aphelenchoides fujianensis]